MFLVVRLTYICLSATAQEEDRAGVTPWDRYKEHCLKDHGIMFVDRAQTGAADITTEVCFCQTLDVFRVDGVL